MCGVDGVNEAGNEGFEELLGGVCDRVGSLIVVECDEGSSVGSGERLGGVGWGIVVSKSSERSNVENVRFASSAVELISARSHCKTHFFLLTLLKMKLAMGNSFLLFRWSGRGAIIMK